MLLVSFAAPSRGQVGTVVENLAPEVLGGANTRVCGVENRLDALPVGDAAEGRAAFGSPTIHGIRSSESDNEFDVVAPVAMVIRVIACLAL